MQKHRHQNLVLSVGIMKYFGIVEFFGEIFLQNLLIPYCEFLLLLIEK
ncbi:hypothetical protein OVS_01195 [Mycoplasma ovis str. Michigan]|uniref:Uncharacterized protein n=1 Tax=Mycoplasma ovis str. Michigan TaxID=1415773 RepID=A0ABM5P181_9MOLU|nr:hypothetical protein OVS_01195 [Mycoplasma ovis str. Michigan]